MVLLLHRQTKFALLAEHSRFSFPLESPHNQTHIVECLPSSTFRRSNLGFATGQLTGRTYHVLLFPVK